MSDIVETVSNSFIKRLAVLNHFFLSRSNKQKVILTLFCQVPLTKFYHLGICFCFFDLFYFFFQQLSFFQKSHLTGNTWCFLCNICVFLIIASLVALL